MKRSKLLMLFLLFLIPTTILSADPKSVLAFYNLSEVISEYYSESASYREIKAIEEELAEKRKDVEEDIQKLQEDLINAREAGDSDRVRVLDLQIQDRRSFLSQLIFTYTNRIREMQSSLGRSGNFASELSRALNRIGVARGFAAIIDITNTGQFHWYSPENLITDDVIAELRRVRGN
jgi:Skp family chaperone for outer membrane proteins